MSTTSTRMTPPATKAPTPSSPEPPAPAETTFLPSPELGEQLERLEEAQEQIDRRKAEELGRLREIQDRD